MALEAEREGKSLFTHSRRTAAPPLNSSVRAEGEFDGRAVPFNAGHLGSDG
jgi:hypothetical protein